MSRILIVGGGAAGMMAAIAAAGNGHQVELYEKNEKLGKKIFITGKGRCNVTNDCDVEELLANVVTNRQFLYSSIYGFTNYDMMELLKACRCPVKTERGNRVFPVSDKSSDVIRALESRMKATGVRIHLHEEVEALLVTDGRCHGIRLKRGSREVTGDDVIIATGGASYPTTGSTGDGYQFARSQGHRVTELYPALVPFEAKPGKNAETCRLLQGLALKNIRVTIRKEKKVLYEEFGEMLFTHYGVSGPVLLSASSFVAKEIRKQSLTLNIDLKPALSMEQLDARILREFEAFTNKQFKNALVHLFPSKLIPIMIQESGIDPEKKIHEITRPERTRLVELTKQFPLTLSGLRGFNEAIITQGGIAVKEINPSTMESKLVNGLYFVGEVLDLDAVTGGFNLQIAWSTGYAAGSAILSD